MNSSLGKFQNSWFCISAQNKLAARGAGSPRAGCAFVLQSVEQRQKPWTLCSLSFFIQTVVASKQRRSSCTGPDSHFIYAEVNPAYSLCLWWNSSEFSPLLARSGFSPWAMKRILCSEQWCAFGRSAQPALYGTCASVQFVTK